MNELIKHIDMIHTTPLGIKRLQKNLSLDGIDVVGFIKNIIMNHNCIIYQKGKNYYCEIDSMIITIHSKNYCIITAHKKKEL